MAKPKQTTIAPSYNLREDALKYAKGLVELEEEQRAGRQFWNNRAVAVGGADSSSIITGVPIWTTTTTTPATSFMANTLISSKR